MRSWILTALGVLLALGAAPGAGLPLSHAAARIPDKVLDRLRVDGFTVIREYHGQEPADPGCWWVIFYAVGDPQILRRIRRSLGAV